MYEDVAVSALYSLPSPRRLASGESIVVLGVCVSVCPAATARRNAALVSAAKVMRCIQCCLVIIGSRCRCELATSILSDRALTPAQLRSWKLIIGQRVFCMYIHFTRVRQVQTQHDNSLLFEWYRPSVSRGAPVFQSLYLLQGSVFVLLPEITCCTNVPC